MPQQLDELETNEAVLKAIDSLGASALKDMGSLMSFLREKYPGQMNFSKAATYAKKKLS